MAGSELLYRVYPLDPLGRAWPAQRQVRPTGHSGKPRMTPWMANTVQNTPNTFCFLSSCPHALLAPPLCFVSVYSQAFPPLQSTAAWRYLALQAGNRDKGHTIHASQERDLSCRNSFPAVCTTVGPSEQQIPTLRSFKLPPD